LLASELRGEGQAVFYSFVAKLQECI
jgi:hypothetical protein